MHLISKRYKLYKSSMSDKFDPIYPTATTNISLKIDGIFAFPQQWKTTDQANPGMFTYVAKFCNMEIAGGKIYPKQMTDKEMRQQEQAKKKGGKKQAKKEESPAEVQRLKQLQEKQEAEERRKQQAWSKMNAQQKFHSASEDRYKSATLRFENSMTEKKLVDSALVAFEEHVEKDGGEWIYIYKAPTANEQQLQKIKKSKPKTLNLVDLNPVCMRAWMDLSPLWSSEIREVALRCKLEQIEQTAQGPKPNLQKTYIKLSIVLGQALVAKHDHYNIDRVIKNPAEPTPIPAEIRCMQQMKQELRVAVESLAMEYSNMFWRDLNANEEQKCSQVFVGNKKNEHIKRKQQFLYDFNVSGKYKVLKQRLKKVIVHLCENKFANRMQGAKSFTGITSSVRDQFYSEIYNFLVTSYSDTIEEMIEEKKQKLNEVFVLDQENQNTIAEQHLQKHLKQTQEDRFTRIVGQYSLVGNYSYGQEMYVNAIARQPQNFDLKYQYSMFCLKNGLNNISQVVSWGYIQQYLERNKGSKSARTQYVLLMIGSEQGKSLRKCWVILRELIDQEPKNVKLLLYAALLLEMLGRGQCANKYKLKAYRNELRKQGRLKEEGNHRAQPAPAEIPSLASLPTYAVGLKPEESDKLWQEIMQSFSALGIFSIVDKIKSKLEAGNNPTVRKQSVKILYSQQQFKECKQQALQLYEESKDFQILQIIINCCHRLRDPEQKVKYLKTALREGPALKKPYALLNLAFFYSATSNYGNCKACITKYLDGNKDAGGLSWQLLGISELMSTNYSNAIECFRHSNLCDPFNKEVWIWLAQAYCKINNFVMVTQCLNCYLNSEAENRIDKIKVKDIKQTIESAAPRDFYQSSTRQKLLQRLQSY